MWSQTPFTGRSMAERHLLLTFDDGPGPDTLDLAEYLAEEDIRAIFFVVGEHVRRWPETVKRLLQLGHFVGNHSQNHLHLTSSFVSDQDAFSEVMEAHDALDELQVPRLRFFRPPYGAWNRHLSHLFNSHANLCLNSVGPVNWNIDGGDYRFWRDGDSPGACAQAYVEAIEKQKKGIVLLHDFCADDKWTASKCRASEMVQILAPRLRDVGYSFSAPDEIPDLKIAMQVGVRCALQAMNGKYAEVDADDRQVLRATAPRRRGAELKLFQTGEGAVRFETDCGSTLWPHLEAISDMRGQSAFRTPEGLLLACDPVTLRIEPASRPVNRTAAFRLVALGAVTPELTGFASEVPVW